MHPAHPCKSALFGLTVMGAVLLGLVATAQAQAPAKKPNILVIFGDDIGRTSAPTHTA